MSSQYQRGGRIYFRLKIDGKWRDIRTEFKQGQERAAQATLDQLDINLEAGTAITGDTRPVTVERFYAGWIKQREALIQTWANDEGVMRLHVLPVLGHLRLDAVRPLHLVELVRALRKKMAPRSVYNAYSTLCAFFRDACLADLLPMHSSPCILTKRQLGPKVDKDPEWRPTALYSRGELEQLISDERVPMDRRVLYGLEGVAGLRHGEAAGLRFRNCNVQPETPPLGMIFVAFGYARPLPKGGYCRPVPIHPTLAAMLAEWRLWGWAEMMGRKPTVDDLVLPLPPDTPKRPGGMRSRNNSHDRFEKDLAVLGMRHRRGHDLRRTMISLSRSDGADADILKRATHRPPTEVMEGYTTFEWAVLCREVAKFNVRRGKTAQVVAIPMAYAVGESRLATGLATSSNQPTKMIDKSDWPPPDSNRGGTHWTAPDDGRACGPSLEVPGVCLSLVRCDGAESSPEAEPACSNVANDELRAALLRAEANSEPGSPAREAIALALRLLGGGR